VNIDPYTFLWVFAAGVLAQGMLIVREPRRMAGVAALAAGSFAVSWWFADRADDVAFQTAIFGTLLFILLFAFIYRDAAMPHISRRALLHYSLLWYYGFWLSAQAAPIDVPAWLWISAAAPVAVTVMLALWPRALWRWVRVTMYVWFLLLMMFLLGRQLSGDRLRETFDQTGFSLELLAYGFVSGAVFLLFGVYFIYATTLLVMPDRRARMFARLTGGEHRSVAGEQAEAMAARVSGAALAPLAGSLVLLHALLLGLNARYGWIDANLLINFSVVAVASLAQYQSAPSSTRASS